MPSTRRTAQQQEAVLITTIDDDTEGGDEVAAAVDARDSALAALLVPSREVVLDPAPAPVNPPAPTRTVVSMDPDGVRWLVWADVYARMVGEDRVTARRGDVVIVPDDELTASHARLGHLIPE